jgi:hypothetical protein
VHYDWLKNIKPIVETVSTGTSDESKRVIHLPEFPKLGPNFRYADNLSTPNIARVEQIQATKKNLAAV